MSSGTASARPARGGAQARSTSSWAATALLAAIMAVAIHLRLVGLSFGLPAVYNPDEIAIMSRTLALATGDLNPHNFLYPTLYFYVLFGWLGAFFSAGWLLGVFPSLQAFETEFFVDPTSVYMAGRALGVVSGVVTVALTYVLARRLFGRAVGLGAALFLAVAPIAVIDAHYVKHDVPATLAIVAAMMAISSIWPGRAGATDGIEDGPPATQLVLAAALCGAATSTHYYAVFLVFPLGAALWLRSRAQPLRRRLRDAIVAAATMAAVFFLCSPFLLVEPQTAWRDIVANRQIVVDRAIETGGGPLATATDYVGMLWTRAMGWPVALLALVGLASLLMRSWRLGLLLAAFPIAFLAFISNTVAASRYLNPVLPFVAIFAAYGLASLTRPWLAARRTPRRPTVVAAAVTMIALLAALPALRDSLRAGRFFEQDDTRTLAQRFLERAVPDGATVLVQPYSVQLAQSRDGLIEALTANLGDASRASTKFARRLALSPYPSPAYRTVFLGDGGLDADKLYVSYHDVGGAQGLRALDEQGVQYVVIKRYNTVDRLAQPFFEALEREGRRIAEFSPYRPDVAAAARADVAPFLHNTDTPIDDALERPGPTIEVWVIGDARRAEPRAPAGGSSPGR